MVVGCGGAANSVVDVREVAEAGGTPRVERVTDLGDLGQIPRNGALLPTFDSDGRFVVGELILIAGSDFGKLPTVQIGGRPAAVEARTGGGGIIARIPTGVPTGAAKVEVSHPDGRHAREIEIERYAFAVQPDAGKLHVLSVTAGGAALATTLGLPGVRDVVFSHDGQAAYALVEPVSEGEPGTLAIIVTTASGGPKVVRHLRLPTQRPLWIDAAAEAPLAAVVAGDAGVLIDLQDPRNPALHQPFPLRIGPAGAAPHDIALDARGQTLALLVSQGNQIIPFDVRMPSQPQRMAEAVAMPSVRHPVLRAFAWAPSGDQLWAFSGDTSLSMAAGQHPTSIIPVEVAHGAQEPLVIGVASEVTGAGAPLAAAAARRAVAPGTAIRSTSKTAAAIVATVHPSLLALAGQPVSKAAANALDAVAEPGVVLRTDLEGESRVLLAVAGVPAGVAVSHDSQRAAVSVVTLAPEGDALAAAFAVALVPLAGGEPTWLQLGRVEPSADVLQRTPIALSP